MFYKVNFLSLPIYISLKKQKLCRLYSVVLLFLVGLLLFSQATRGDQETSPSLYGRAIEFDPGFAYFRNRSPQSIAEEMKIHGYRVVYYVLTADSDVQPALIHALHREGIRVWYATFANGAYSKKDLPADWPTWKMVTRCDLEGHPLEDGFVRLCLNNPQYRAWKKRQIVHMLRHYPFNGVALMEPYWPEYPGPQSPEYGCFCSACQRFFHKMFPHSSLPDILNPDSPNSPQHNPLLWQRWMAYRRASVLHFLNDLINGPDGIRAKVPNKSVCVWTLALSGPDAANQLESIYGLDAPAIALTVHPDAICFETDWPDWCQANLSPYYVLKYKPLMDAVRAVAPHMPLVMQADIGSQTQDRRDSAWISSFEKACAAMGFQGTLLYAYSLGADTYYKPPSIAKVLVKNGSIRLVFTCCVGASSAGDILHYRFSGGPLLSAHVDGNVVTLTPKTPPKRGAHCTLTLLFIANDSGRLFFHDAPPAILEKQTINFVWSP